MKKRRIKKGPVAVVLFIIIVVLIGSLFMFKSVFMKNPDDSPIQLNKSESNKNYLTLVMVGDVLIHGSLYQDAIVELGKYDFRYIFKDVEPLLNNYDLKFYNQESIIGGKELGLSSYPRFNSPEEIGDAMVELGFNLVSLANNHTLDKGETGVVNSLNYWKQHDVMTAGSYLSEEHRVKNNIKVMNDISYTLLSYTAMTNGIPVPKGKEYLVNVYEEEKVKEDVKRVRDEVDLLIVSMHWGNEYSNTESDSQREKAEYLASLGVDIIIGHHPHVIQPIEKIDDTLVFYSLGNFLSAQNTVDRLTGLIASLEIIVEKKDDETKLSFGTVNTDLVYTYYESFRNFRLIPFSMLTTTELRNYKQVYDKYYDIIKKYDDSIIVTELGDR